MSTRATASNSLPQPGFRLHRLEVRNWGTFDGKIHILDPLGKTALLIGENGSGKSTLVDALLTLLVPRTKRNYNMSAGAVKKRERDERTYVLGAYGSESGSEESRAQIKFLRKKPGSPPTILLACFLNDATGEAVSLGQMLWVQDDDVRKLFLIARSARSIKGDFGGLQESKSWKKALKRGGFEVEESFNDYAEKAVRYLKMESTTTLALFSQTVAIKEITHVSTFIRDHMLERLDTRELMERLEQHYEDLTKCWDAKIQVAAYEVSESAVGWKTDAPGNALWPKIEGSSLRIIATLTDPWWNMAESEKEAFIKTHSLNSPWKKTDLDTSLTGLVSSVGQKYASNGYGWERTNYVKGQL